MKYTLRKRKIKKGVKKCLGVLGGQANHLVKSKYFHIGILQVQLLWACRDIK